MEIRFLKHQVWADFDMEFVRCDNAEEFDAYLVSRGWPSTACFHDKTAGRYTFDKVQRQWIRAIHSPRGYSVIVKTDAHFPEAAPQLRR